MPRLDPDRTKVAVSRLFQAAGVPVGDADVVSRELVTTEQMGITSHGLIRVMQYLADIDSGRVIAGAEVKVTHRDRACVIVDGGWNLGIVTAWAALEQGVSAAREHGVSTVVTHGCNHAGRLGSYARSAARDGMVCIAGAAIPKLGHFVVPWGARDGRLGTNPFAYGFPTEGEPIVADFATSVVPEGVIRSARLRGATLPGDAVLDANGDATTDPNEFYGPPRGSLLPFGGSVGHKGYALGLLVELLGGTLAGLVVDDDDRQINGVFFLVIDPTALLPTGSVEELGQQVVDYMHSARPSPGSETVMVPGEPESRALADAAAFDVDDAVWAELQALATRFGVELNEAEAA